MKKKIGISFTRTKFEQYLNWITEKDLADDLELITLSFEKNNTEDIHQCDGFILTGGVDVDPSFYQGDKDYVNKPDTHQADRDIFEKKIYEYSQLHHLPLLGICRGMQLVNVLQGGKLIQDLDHGNLRHDRKDIDKEHAIVTDPDSLLFNITGKISGHVNSAHHQAIDPGSIGENLKVTAHEEHDEQIIEAIEFLDKSGKGFMLCLQWHPERMKDKEENIFSKNIKKEFLAAVRKTRNKKLPVINPANDEMIYQLNEDNPGTLGEKLKQIRNAQPAWYGTSLAERIGIINKFSELLKEQSDRIAAVLTREVGKPLQQSLNEINGARARIQWLTENAEKYLSDEMMTSEQNPEEWIRYEPLGVICNISAWNYPYLVGVNVFIPALLSGNGVLYKPSEFATGTGLEIEKLLKLAGVPDQVFQVAVGDGSVGRLLLDLNLDGYFFTGSYKTGKFIYEKVAPKMVPCQCEMGGKDPLYVADDISDIKSVAAGTADGAFYNNGQSCCAVERIYVHEKIFDGYVDEFVNEVNSWKTGDPNEAGTYIGAITRKEQLDILESQVDEAIKKGALLLTGGKKPDRKGNYFSPAVLINVNHEMSLMKEESFGPVIGIMKVQNDEEAVQLMRDTDYGLTASVYSSDKERAMKILEQINTGTGYWNCCDRVSAALPWSGRKHSGFGVTLSHAGIRAFVKPKAYHFRG